MRAWQPWALFGAVGVAMVQDARAADVFAAAVVAIVPPGAVEGDERPVRVHVIARGTDGAPLAGLKLTPSASEGRADDWKAEDVGYSFRFTPPKTTAPVDVRLSVKGEGPSGPIDVSAEVPVHPTGTARVQITAEPAKLVLGKGTTSTVTFSLDGDLDTADLEARAGAGTLSALEPAGSGKWTATYTPPAVNYPHLALITVAARDRAGVVGQGLIALQGAVDFPVDAPAGSPVSLEIAGQTYGPVDADPSGHAAVPIIVSPGISAATRVISAGATRKTSALDLQIPDTRRIGAVPLGYPAEVGVARPIRWVVRKADGAPDTSATVSVKASSGTAGPVRNLGDGLYEGMFAGESVGTVTLTASLGSGDVQTVELEVPVLAPFPASASPTFSPPAPSTGGIAHVVVIPEQRVLRADNKSKASLIVAATDPGGHPIPGASIALSATRGAVPATVTADSKGVARVSFTAGKETGLAEITARAGGRTSRASVLLADGDVTGLVWPRSNGVQGRWEGLLTDASVAAASTPVAAPVTRVDVELPASASAGSEVLVTLRATRLDGLGVAGRPPTLDITGADAGPVEDAGDGVYTATLTLPRDASGELVVRASVGDTRGEARLPIDPPAVSAKVPRPEREGGQHPRLRVQVGGLLGSYDYAQRPEAEPGPLLDQPLVIGGPDGEGAALQGGGELDVRAWFVPWFGVHALGRLTRYEVANDAFSEPVPDALFRTDLDLAARAPIAVGENLVWIGVNAGFTLDDMQYYEGCLQAGCQVDYAPLVLPGLGIGGAIGAEVGRVHFLAGVQQALAQGTIPYRIGAEADLGVGLTEAVYVHLGFDVISRRAELAGAQSGLTFARVQDTQILGQLGFGLQF